MKRVIDRGSSRRQIRPFARGVPSRIFQNSRAPKVLPRQSMPDAATINSSVAESRIRVAARTLAKAGLVHRYGHCRARLEDHGFLVSPPKPLGLVTTQDVPVVVATSGKLPPGALPEVIA